MYLWNEHLKYFITLKDSGRQIIGIDFSDTKIGVAISNWVIATPFEVITKNPMKKLNAICKEFNIIGAVIGHPINMDSSVGYQAKKVENFAKVFFEITNVDYILFDERLTTFQAKQLKHQKNTDAIAAQIILEDFLKTII